MGRVATSAVLLTLSLFAVAGCGGAGGGGGVADGPASWAIPFVPTTGASSLFVGLRNLDDSSTTVSVTGYRPDGTAYALPLAVTIDGQGEEILSLSDAIGGVAAAGGALLVSTPSRHVDVYFDVEIPVIDAADASRAFALPDLSAPPPGPFRTGVNATTLTTAIQLGNASGALANVTVTAYEEDPLDPLAPPTSTAVVLAPFAAGESRVYTPAALSGIPGFTGSFLVESPAPVFAASQESSQSLAYDVPRVATKTRNVAVALLYGRDNQTIAPTFLDFALVARNDNDGPATLTITRIAREDGFALYSGVRSIPLEAHESRVVTTTDAPFDDLFGDVLLASTFQRISLELSVPAGVDVGLREFEPQALVALTSFTPCPYGHSVVVSDVFPSAVLPSSVRTFASVVNPSNAAITVTYEALVPQPSGFDAAPQALGTLSIPAHGRVDVSPDGLVFVNRDLVAVDYVGLRFRSSAPVCVTAWRATRSGTNAVQTLVSLPVRALDDGE